VVFLSPELPLELMNPAGVEPGKITLLGLVLILAGTLFPYHFSSREFVNFTNSFGLSSTIARRSNDLQVGIDAASGQPFYGKIDQLCIYPRTLTQDEIVHLNPSDPECVIRKGGELPFRIRNNPSLDI